MLVNCFFALVSALQGGAAVSAAPTELLGCCLVGALQGGAAVPARLCRLPEQELHQQSCGAFNRLVHLRQVHPLKAPWATSRAASSPCRWLCAQC